jgi:hypothetical protein
MIPKEQAYDTVGELVERFGDQILSYKKTDYNETLVRRDFIDPFFKALGWDVDNSQGYAEAYREVIHEDRVKVSGATKAPDYSFRLPGGKRLFFVEAKKPSVVVKTEILPAYQLRRYAWSAKMPISILTDFEELSIYDCTKKPNPTDKASTGRNKYLTYNEYLSNFDFIWNTFAKERVLKGGLDKFIAGDTNKKGTATVDKEFLASLDEWRIQLAYNIALRNPAYTEDELNFTVQQTIDRIIFLRIAEDRGVEDYGRLQKSIAAKGKGAGYANLFDYFREADEKYNSGLFDFNKDQLSASLNIDDKVLKDIITHLYYPVSPYEFSVLSVEILGSAYEQFLGKQIKLSDKHKAVIEEKPEVRKAGGVYYTPQYIVEYIVENTIGKLIDGKTPEQVADIKIVDPACGSGSFLIGAYDYLQKWHLNYYRPEFTRLSEMATDTSAATKAREAAIKQRSKLPVTPDGNLTTALKKQILLNNIYGVDLDTQAVEVTKLSLLLKCMEGETGSSINAEMRFGERVLPTLDNNIKSGNSLIDLDFYEIEFDFGEEKKIKPFSWQKAFPGVFNPVRKKDEPARKAGFDVVIGNPPYIRIQSIIETSPEQANYFNKKYKSAAKGNYDIYVAFIEKALELINKDGKVGFILPHKFFTAQYGEGIREVLLEKKCIDEIIHFGHEQIFETATTYTCILTLQGYSTSNIKFYRVNDLEKWRSKNVVAFENISFENLGKGDWNFTSGKTDQLLKKLAKLEPLGSITDRIFQGLKTSADKIYIVNKLGETEHTFKIQCPQNEKEYIVEKDLFHPLIKGGDSIGFIFKVSERLILFPYANSLLIDETTLRKTYPLTYSYLKEHKTYLEDRENGKMRTSKWYAYVYPKALDVILTRKIFTADISPKANYSYDQKGDLFFTGGAAGGYGIKVKKEFNEIYILGLLNSKVLDWYLKQTSTQMRGGWYSFEAKYIKHLPIVIPSKSEKDLESEIVKQVTSIIELKQQKQTTNLPEKIEQLSQRVAYTDEKINKLVFELYGLSEEEVAIVEQK